MTTNVSNQGIAHLSFKAGGMPFCRSRKAHIVCAAADRDRWPRLCVRCARKHDAMLQRTRSLVS